MTREIADLLSNDTSIKNYGGTSGTSAEWPASGAFDKIIGFQSARSGWAAVEKAAVTKNLYLKTPKNIVLTNYTIETRIDCCVYETPTNWTLSGSTDGLTWAPRENRLHGLKGAHVHSISLFQTCFFRIFAFQSLDLATRPLVN